MEPLEIVCESCESRMRLSETLLEKIVGSSGRVTCPECSKKILLDATQGHVRVIKGGRFASEREIQEIEDFTEAPPSVDPHLSELPLVPAQASAHKGLSSPPPLPLEARARSMGPRAKPGNDVAAASQLSGAAKEWEAPVPHFSSAGSLSPLSLSDDDDDGLVPLGREFNSSPFASERDQSYNSLFPQPERRPSPQNLDAPVPMVSRTPSPPQRGELRRGKSEPELFHDELSNAPAVAATIVEMGPGGELINQADRKSRAAAPTRSSHWVPWTVAAIALFGLGVSVSLDRRAPAHPKAPEAVAVVDVDRTESDVVPAAAGVAPTQSDTDPAVANVDPVVVALTQTEVAQVLQGDEIPSEEPSLAVTRLRGAQAEGAAAPASDSSATAPVGTDTSGPVTVLDEPDSTKEADNKEEGEERALAPFSSAAAATALREATALAGACRKSEDPSGYATVLVTFAPSGRVTSAELSGAPFAGTETGGCIASRFRTARVPPFAGQHVTVKKTVTIQ